VLTELAEISDEERDKRFPAQRCRIKTRDVAAECKGKLQVFSREKRMTNNVIFD